MSELGQKFKEHLQSNIGNLVSDVNISMFRFRSLLHVTQEFPFESLGIPIKWEVNRTTQIGTSNDGQNISARGGIYTVDFIFLVLVSLVQSRTRRK